ncbi:elongation factor Ts [Patescibacteria group bacterium]|nr:elongation factor Ts [Patescibacteria group bacterium]
MSDKEILIKLRRQTGAGIMDIKEALEESGNDQEKALKILRKKGQKIAAKRADREAGEGFIGSYVHSNGKIATIVKLQCETDFVARNEDFRALAKDLAMHITATDPVCVSKEDAPEDAQEEDILLNQKFVKDESKKIQDLLDEAAAKIGEKIEVSGFSRLQI